MQKYSLEMLGMIITTLCNLDCKHCLHGKKENLRMSDEVIKATLNQIRSINCLTICGGEATLALDRMEYIINYIIKNHIPLKEFTITINGTNYSEELLRLLKEISDYIKLDEINAFLGISCDIYHIEEMKKLGLFKEYMENIEKYMESKYFYSLRGITNKLFREGNAVNLDKSLTVPLKPPQKYITYINKDKKYDENGLCFIGPIVSVNAKGIITECDASDINQETIYNYGSVFETTFEESALNNGATILKQKKYIRACQKEWKRYNTYKK